MVKLLSPLTSADRRIGVFIDLRREGVFAVRSVGIGCLSGDDRNNRENSEDAGGGTTHALNRYAFNFDLLS
ncbi:hypothetical protein HP467_03570 [Curtobacterium albidum]|uniref:Uncharacterized protein n=1 Tax=Curtobacterium citreum TaxID=2036 RepID=A0A850DNP0_9MICO|nr:hypothetical protein [Curtobacterium albidum]NUU27196.1 hypothetical protein [Curtobacterium albidum]